MIGYYVHHHGAGHATRACSIAHALVRAGEQVTGFSSLPRPASWTGPWVQLPRDDDPGPGSDADVTAGGALHWAPLRHAGYAGRMGRMATWIAETRPSAVVVDVSVEVTLMARLLGAPTVVLAMRGRRDDAAHVSAYDAATALIAPWSDTLPEDWWPPRWLGKTRHVGAISRFDHRISEPDGERVGAARPADATRAPDRPRGLLLWGRGGTWQPDLADLRVAMPSWSWKRPVPGQDVWPELMSSDVVVCHAGQNAVAEVAAARRPAVVIADPRPFVEQEHTVEALSRAGLAATATRWPTPGEWPALVSKAQRLGGAGWAFWNDGGGAARAASAILAVARDRVAPRPLHASAGEGHR